MDNQLPEINVDELMHRIRQEVKQRKANMGTSNPVQHMDTYDPAVNETIPAIGLQLPRLEEKRIYPDEESTRDLNQLLKYHDQQFIFLAYRVILQREPDAKGFQHFLHQLRSGSYSKVDILGRLRYCAEGRAKKVPVKGLLIPLGINVLGKIPVLGYPVRWTVALLRLPVFVKNYKNFEAYQSARENNLRQQIDHWGRHITSATDELNRTLALIDQKFSTVHTRLHEKADKAQINKSIADMKRSMHDQGRRLARLLEEARKRLPEPISEEQILNMISEEDHLLDAMYASFEDQFRGTRQDIKNLQQIYLEPIEKAGAGTNARPVIDLGCGRGEWLELLAENNKTAIGVDINKIFVSSGQDLGLDIIEQDALTYLRSLKASSAGAITSFHLIEHLPLKTLVALFDECFRVLKTGGVAIFETPNPENMKVGSCNFYIDPTHRNPLPPMTTKFLMEAQGFNNCDILRIHPFDESAIEKDFLEKNQPALINAFYGPQDYAVIGYKL